LDHYDSDNIDDEVHENIDITARRNLEKMMDERDAREGRTAADYLLDSMNNIFNS